MRGKRSSEYGSWSNMIQRCDNPKNTHFKYYGGKGIFVCERWHDFSNFLADMGLKPTLLHTIERRNKAGNYCLSNCYWATRKEQMNNTSRNRFLTHDGITLTVAQWAEKTGLVANTIHNRIRAQWSVKNALTIKP
jgi:hypothetical protein